jgi:hypothetical protein
MQRTVLTFGLISGVIIAALMWATLPFMERIGYDNGAMVGYAGMVLAFLLIFFGVRSYRDNVAGGAITFGRAFRVGGLIALVSATCYVISWQVLYKTVLPDFGEKYIAFTIEKERASGVSEEVVAAKAAEMEKMFTTYKNNALFRIGVTYLEPLPVALVVALVTAGVLSRRRRKRKGRRRALRRSAPPLSSGGGCYFASSRCHDVCTHRPPAFTNTSVALPRWVSRTPARAVFVV